MESKSILIKDYKLFKKIGKGRFGVVYLAIKKNSPEIFAAKRIDLRNVKESKKKYLDNEKIIMKEKLDHPNLIHLFDFIQSTNHYYVIMEYCNGGSLSSCFEKFGYIFPIEITQHLMRQLVDALKYMHSKGIIHRDLKLENILLNFKNKEDKEKCNLFNSDIKIIDFGLSIKIDSNRYAKGFVGTPFYMAPIVLENEKKEYYDQEKYDEKVDIWSLGTIFYHLYTGQRLYEDANNIFELKEKVKSGEYTIPINIKLYNEAIAFLNSMLQYEGENRLSASELSEHPFLTQNIKDFTEINLNQISDKIVDNAISMNSLRGNGTVIFGPSKTILSRDDNHSEDISQNNKKRLIRFTNLNKDKDIISNNGDNNLQKNQLANDEIETIERMLIEINQKEITEKKNSIKKENENEYKLNWSKDLKKSINYINGILYEYNQAKTYFHENDLIKQEQDAYYKIVDINKKKAQLESGILINERPIPVNTEYIYGYSVQDRNNKFQEVLSKYINDKNKIEVYLKSCSNSNKKQILEYKKNKLDFILQELQNKYNNIWTPAPKYTKDSKLYKIEKISYTNCDFNMKIQLKKLDNKKEKINFIIFLKINQLKSINKQIQLNFQDDFYDEWIWSLKYNEWKNIDNNNENFIFGINIGNNSLNQNQNKDIKCDISKIINGKIYAFNIGVPIQNNDKITFKVTITPIFPKGQKYTANEMKNIIIVKKIYPAFNGKYFDN